MATVSLVAKALFCCFVNQGSLSKGHLADITWLEQHFLSIFGR
jgi:hypothetical protein